MLTFIDTFYYETYLLNMQVKYTHSLYILFEQTLYSHICIKYHRLNNPIYRHFYIYICNFFQDFSGF